MRKPAIFISFNIAIIVILSVIQVVVANSISTTGIELGKIQDKIGSLKKQNAILHEQVLTLSSFKTIASRAAEMGFKEENSTFDIASPLPLARR